MKKKGFTLIELLAVILILGIIALIAIPTVNKILDESRRGAFKSTLDNIDRAISQKCTTEQIKSKPHVTTYTITDGKIEPTADIKGDLPDGIIYVDLECGVTYELANNNFLANKDTANGNVIVSDCNGNCLRYNEAILNGATPKLDSGMIPIIINNNGTVTKADMSKKWYSYQNQEWANVVLVTDASRSSIINAQPGSIINSNDILAYLVWIPRYKYFITTSGTSTPSSVNIVFENKTTPKSSGNAISSYYTHPAFTFGNTEVDGMWVGKFETTGDNNAPTILPNLSSLRNLSIKAQFDTARRFGNYGISGDAHLMKNSEWGAMAYLSRSIYGIDDEIRINNNSDYTTGCGASSANASAAATCPIAYGNGNADYPQSTTGNITGIFDTAGGAWEYVMGNYNNTLDLSEFPTMPDSKYFDLYLTDDCETACSGNKCIGHANYETKNWYGDYYFPVTETYPWVDRGGSTSDRTAAGIFSMSYYNGKDMGSISFRLTFLLGV